jgi:hypothetical protein
MSSSTASGRKLALDIMRFSVQHPSCKYVVPTGADAVVEKSLADFVCRLFSSTLSPLQPTTLVERDYMRYLTTVRRVVLQQCCSARDGPDASMRAQAARLAPEDKQAVWVLMARVVMEQLVELAAPDSETWETFQTVLNEPASMESTTAVRMPYALGADTAFTADQLA